MGVWLGTNRSLQIYFVPRLFPWEKIAYICTLHRDVAQLVEYASGGRVVAGSSPVIPTTKPRTVVAFSCLFRTLKPMDYAFERDWQTLVKRMMERFGEEPDVTSMVFAVGLQEAGQGARRYKR